MRFVINGGGSMRTVTQLVSVVSILATALFAAVPAGAGTIYVAPDGANTATCGSQANPCQTLNHAHGRVDPGGTILLTDPGNYGPATFTKGLNVRGVPGAGVFSPATPCITINAAGGNDTITITNFSCDMDGAAKDGILLNDAHKLRLENVSVRGATGAMCGVRVRPISGFVELMVNNSSLTENGTTGTNNGGGICILPTNTANVLSVIRNSTMQNNRHGLVSAPAGSAVSNVLTDNSDFSGNAGGIFSVGANSHVCVRHSTITNNSVLGLGGVTGQILNGGDNLLWMNTIQPFNSTCP
jgi:hypothetical protein